MSIPNTQWNFLIVSESFDIRGTNEQKVAVAAIDSGDTVIETATCTTLDITEEGELIARPIAEQTWFQLS